MGILITFLAVAVRLAWVWFVPTRPVGDFAMYLESARHLVEHRALDGEFIYMPGYVYLVAAVVALGGGLFAIKMIGVVAGGLATAAVFGTAQALFGRATAIAAGLLCALWPAGIAVSSVTGTDMPAAALLATAVWLLARYAGDKPLGAPVLFGFLLGLTAYVRAVALPLALFPVLHFRARGALWVHAITRSLAALLVAMIVLLPWGVRNRRVYGEFFLTDSHGGHTALVGANPNTDGVYSRSLNQMFAVGTGHKLFVPPHRPADHAAYALAKDWTTFDPKYAAGLLVAKADRLLTHERPLLYWPLYRESVLPENSRVERWFAGHRAALEKLVDGFWYALIGAVLIGLVAAVARRNWAALSLLPMPLALTGLYVVFFAEVRYHLAIAVLMMPFAGAGVVWVGELARDLGRFAIDRQRRPRLPGEALAAAISIALVFLGWPRLVAAGEQLRERHRWAVCICTVGSARRLCNFRPVEPAVGSGRSPLIGVWDGFGLKATGNRVAAGTNLELPAGDYDISILVESSGAPVIKAVVELRAGAAPPAKPARIPWPAPGAAEMLTTTVTHGGGRLQITVATEGDFSPSTGAVPTLWISAVEVATDPPQ